MWWKEIVRVSPSALAFCKFWLPKKTKRAAMLQQEPARTERKDNRFLCATFAGTCQPLLAPAPCSAAKAAGDKLRRSRRLPTATKTADALFIREGLTRG